jgi:hypothetical protein
MFLGIYRFEGDADRLRKAYDRMLAQIPPDGLHLHVCVTEPGALTMYDACPSKEIFQAFAASAELERWLEAAGLPSPTVTLVGEVHAAFVSGERVY